MAVRFCTTHRIGYNTQLEAICPQCTLARITPAEQLDVDAQSGLPMKGGQLLDPHTLQPPQRFDPNTGRPILSVG